MPPFIDLSSQQCDELALPAKNGVELDDRGDFLQGLLAQLLADVRSRAVHSPSLNRGVP